MSIKYRNPEHSLNRKLAQENLELKRALWKTEQKHALDLLTNTFASELRECGANDLQVVKGVMLFQNAHRDHLLEHDHEAGDCTPFNAANVAKRVMSQVLPNFAPPLATDPNARALQRQEELKNPTKDPIAEFYRQQGWPDPRHGSIPGGKE